MEVLGISDLVILISLLAISIVISYYCVKCSFQCCYAISRN